MKCPHCPATGAHCIGEGVPRLCRLAEARADYRALIVRESAALTASPRPPGPPDPAPPVAAIDPAYWSLVAGVEACDFRVATCHCLSRPARCLLAGLPALVTLEDCRSCPDRLAGPPRPPGALHGATPPAAQPPQVDSAGPAS